MFKGTLIENTSYYSLRTKQLLYVILPSIAIGLLVNFYQMPIWITIGAIALYAMLILMTYRNKKAMRIVANKRIEIAQNKIEIKDEKGAAIETIKIEKDDKLIVKSDYNMAQETLQNLKEEIKGNPEQHFVILEKNKIRRRFDFVIESYYMLNQLKKLVQEWKKNNLLIEYL